MAVLKPNQVAVLVLLP